jgi:chorismate lyase/3-hydroxybenzoate synthase
MTRPETSQQPGPVVTPRIEYRALPPGEPLPADVLAAVTFGNTHRHADPRCVRVGLEPLRGAGIVEIWHAAGAVKVGFDGWVRYTHDEEFLLAAIEIDERQVGGITAAAELAYNAVRAFQTNSPYPHILRMWNYFDSINQGTGDRERYKQFCLGRAAALSHSTSIDYPAATAIGRRDGSPILQVYWLAARRQGMPLENPRQLSAYRYPRQYGPAAPSFSRAMLVEQRLLMISGTASIIGHASHHPGNLQAQIEETLRNLSSVMQRAAAASTEIPSRLHSGSLLKIYLRDAAAVDIAEAVLRERLPKGVPYMILAADICREDLLVEFDCIHGAQSAFDIGTNSIATPSATG